MKNIPPYPTCDRSDIFPFCELHKKGLAFDCCDIYEVAAVIHPDKFGDFKTDMEKFNDWDLLENVFGELHYDGLLDEFMKRFEEISKDFNKPMFGYGDHGKNWNKL